MSAERGRDRDKTSERRGEHGRRGIFLEPEEIAQAVREAAKAKRKPKGPKSKAWASWIRAPEWRCDRAWAFTSPGVTATATECVHGMPSLRLMESRPAHTTHVDLLGEAEDRRLDPRDPEKEAGQGDDRDRRQRERHASSKGGSKFAPGTRAKAVTKRPGAEATELGPAERGDEGYDLRRRKRTSQRR